MERDEREIDKSKSDQRAAAQIQPVASRQRVGLSESFGLERPGIRIPSPRDAKQSQTENGGNEQRREAESVAATPGDNESNDDRPDRGAKRVE